MLILSPQMAEILQGKTKIKKFVKGSFDISRQTILTYICIRHPVLIASWHHCHCKDTRSFEFNIGPKP